MGGIGWVKLDTDRQKPAQPDGLLAAMILVALNTALQWHIHVANKLNISPACIYVRFCNLKTATKGTKFVVEHFQNPYPRSMGRGLLAYPGHLMDGIQCRKIYIYEYFFVAGAQRTIPEQLQARSWKG